MPLPALTRFAHRCAAREQADGELVRQFAVGRSEAAFAELVRRHGPAVFGVCRRALGDHHLAEDAFQAVFVVLARKAHAIRPPDAVGAWLYGVARKAAAAAGRRRKRLEALPGTLPDRPAAAAVLDDTAAAVDAEIADLPAIFRVAVVLCEIEGVSRAEAAARLGIAPGTLSSRLAAARKLLAERLRRRGVWAAVGAAAVPAALAQAAAGRADGRAAGAIHELSTQVMRTMLLSKLKLASAAAVAALIAAALAATSGPEAAAGAPRPHASPAPATAVTVAGRAKAPQPPRVPPPAARKPDEWKAVFTLEHSHPVAAVAAGADLIATAADVGKGEYVRFWSAADGTASGLEVSQLGYAAPVRFNFLRFTTGDEHLVVGSEFAATRYRRRPGGLAADCLAGYDLLACSADLNTLLVRKDPAAFKGAKPGGLYLHVNPWAVQGNFLKESAAFGEDGAAVTHADVSADDARIAVAWDDGAVRVYDRATLKLLHTVALPKKTAVAAVRLSAGGRRLAVVGAAGFARLYDDAGKEVCDLKGHDGAVAAVAFSPDGKRVATAAGKVARVFDAATGRLTGELAGHSDAVTAVAFGTDGKRVVTGSADKTARVWERKD